MRTIEVNSLPVPHSYASGCWGGLSTCDKDVYFGLCTHNLTENAHLCRYQPGKNKVTEISEFRYLLGDSDDKIGHGKLHTKFLVHQGVAYFATHIGYYRKDLQGVRPYEGGRLFAIKLDTNEVFDLGIVLSGEGVTSLTLDAKRGHIYALTWPNAHLVQFDIANKRYLHLGKFRRGERGDTVCRSPVIAQDCLAFSTGDGVIQCLDLETHSFFQMSQTLPEVALTIARERQWQIPDSVPDSMSIQEYRQLCIQNPVWDYLWQEGISEADGSALVITNCQENVLRILPKSDKIEFLGQCCVGENQTKFDTGTSTSLTLVRGTGNCLYHIGTELVESNGKKRVRKRLLKFDLETGKTSELGYMKTQEGLDVIYLQTLDMLPDGNLCGVGLVDLPNSELAAFKATSPAKIDVGISAEDNPYKMQFFIIPLQH